MVTAVAVQRRNDCRMLALTIVDVAGINKGRAEVNEKKLPKLLKCCHARWPMTTTLG